MRPQQFGGGTVAGARVRSVVEVKHKDSQASVLHVGLPRALGSVESSKAAPQSIRLDSGRQENDGQPQLLPQRLVLTAEVTQDRDSG